MSVRPVSFSCDDGEGRGWRRQGDPLSRGDEPQGQAVSGTCRHPKPPPWGGEVPFGMWGHLFDIEVWCCQCSSFYLASAILVDECVPLEVTPEGYRPLVLATHSEPGQVVASHWPTGRRWERQLNGPIVDGIANMESVRRALRIAWELCRSEYGGQLVWRRIMGPGMTPYNCGDLPRALWAPPIPSAATVANRSVPAGDYLEMARRSLREGRALQAIAAALVELAQQGRGS